MRWLATLTVLAVLPGLALAEPPTTRPPATATTESSRLGVEYFVQKNGATWVFALGDKPQDKTRGKQTITAFADWRAHYSYTFGKRSGTGAWFAREGAWMERTSARGDVDAVVLPVVMSRGTRWAAPASIERGGGKLAQYEVVALEAAVELPNGLMEHCLAVLETAPDGSDPWTHYYAPNVGKVAVLSPQGWLYRLVEYRSGSRHAE
jgi:hypothetical protein